MSIQQRAKTDWAKLSQSVFDLELKFQAPAPGNEAATIKGIGTNNWVQFVNTDGQDAMGQTARITFSESVLKEENESYPIRDSDGNMAMFDHVVNFKDANGNEGTFKIKQIYDDKTTGVVTCDVQKYKQNNN